MKLYKHQKQALAWLEPKPKAILALDMGLGKTCVSSLNLTVPALVVCPASLKLNWQKELAMWRPELSVQVVQSPKDQLTGAHVTIVNYDILAKLELPEYKTVVVDEAHYIKNYKAKRTKLMMGLIKTTPNVRLLTGTPIVNRPIELWTQLYAIGATKLGYFEFGMRFCAGWKTPWDTYDFTGSSRQAELVKLLDPVMLRMTKEECIDLPAKTYRIISLDLPVDKRESKFDLSQIDTPGPIAFEAISDIRRLNAERKLDSSITYIKDCLEQTYKIVVFAHHTHIIDGIMQALSDYGPVVVTGSVKNEDRQKAVESFQTDPKCRVFIGNIKAAGVGLTLTAASHVVFVEAPWSPSDLQQAADRCHRIGQNVNVTVDLLTIKASIDELILHKILTKMDIIDAIIKESKDMNTKLIAAKLRELAELFEANEEPIAKIIDQANEEPIAKIIDQANEEPIAKIIDQANDNQLKAVEEAAKLVEATKPAKAVKPVPTEPSKQMPIEPITIDTIRQAMAKLIGSGKRDLALSILAKVGVAKVSEIPEDKFDFVMVAINE
jgi:SWI/SNF-related matrix-associated actin-dependent regulator 1 of chromatin subfamily A